MHQPHSQVIADLHYVFRRMPLRNLRHLSANSSRLVNRRFDDGNGGKCIFALLTEVCPPARQIVCRSSLIRYYGNDEQAEHYQPARALVRLWDGLPGDPVVVQRYGRNVPPLTKGLLLHVLRQAIRRRVAQLRRRNALLSRYSCATRSFVRPHRAGQRLSDTPADRTAGRTASQNPWTAGSGSLHAASKSRHSVTSGLNVPHRFPVLRTQVVPT